LKSWLSTLCRKLLPFRSDADMADELRAHFESLVEDGMASGLTRVEARRRARLQLGHVQGVIENVRQGEFSTMLEGWYRDFSLGLRGLRRDPVFAVTAILTLTVGIGANTVVFTLLYGLLLRSLPVEDPDRLVRIGISSPGFASGGARPIPYHMLREIRDQQKSWTGLSAWGGRTVSLEIDGSPRMLLAGLVTGNGFEVLGMKPHLGRLLTPDDDIRGGPSHGWSVVLGYGLWKDNFGGDPSIIGSRLRIGQTLVTVIGVTASEFRGVWPGSDAKLYLPFQFLPVLAGIDQINAPEAVHWVRVIGRLKAGVSHQAAQAELKVYEKDLLRRFVPPDLQRQPWFQTAALSLESARTGLPSFFGDVYSKPLYLMQGLVAIVLLLCCVNVGGLMMSKVYARRQEFAIRTAIGAARWRLMRQYLTESFAIALAGAALGAAAAWYGTGYLLPFFRHPNEGTGMSIEPDRAILLTTGFFAVLTTVLFGTMPAWRAGATNPGNLLRSRTPGAARRQALGRAFVPIQVGLSFALVSIATLLSQSLYRLQTEQTGFDLDHVTIQTAPFHVLNLKENVRMELYRNMRDRLQQSAGVNSASYTWMTPMTSFEATSAFQAVADSPDAPQDPHMPYNQVGPGYFRTMKTAILAGREFHENEQDRSVCILNQSAAAFLFPNRNPIGEYVRTIDTVRFPQPVTCRVIALAQDAKYANLHEAPPRTLYFPASAQTLRETANFVFLINAATKSQAVAAYRAAQAELAPSVPFNLFVTLREQMDAALGSQKALSLMSNFFAVLALFLSGLGLYGLLSSSVAQRTTEIGVRMALGAERRSVVRMIVTDALILLTAGLVLGAAVLAFSARFAENLLYGVSAFDPLRIAAITVVLGLVAIVAALFPARRAASVDPILALRVE
jgi:predicted permease